MQQEDVGVTFSVPSTMSLQNVTSVSIVVLGPTGTITTLPAIVGNTPLLDSNGNTVAAAYYWAYRVTTNTDFPVSGTYYVQLVEITASSQNIASSRVAVSVGPRISP